MSALPSPAPAAEPTAPLAFLRLTRPRQWPILSVQLAVGVLAAPAAAALVHAGPWPDAGLLARAWLAWVVCLNGGTLAYNSAWDRDTTPVAYLADPPEPPPGTAAWALALMLAGVPLGWSVSPLFGSVVAGCVALSVGYSHPRTRWKGVPGLDLLINVAGYGFGTTLAGLVAGAAAAGAPAAPDAAGWWLAAGFGLLFGSFYPMTQIYQMEADRARGDVTLALRLGVGRALAAAWALGLAATVCLLRWTALAQVPPAAPASALGLWLAGTAAWGLARGRLGERGHARAMDAALVVWAMVDLAVLAARFAG